MYDMLTRLFKHQKICACNDDDLPPRHNAIMLLCFIVKTKMFAKKDTAGHGTKAV
jgi:hypothetical protein